MKTLNLVLFRTFPSVACHFEIHITEVACYTCVSVCVTVVFSDLYMHTKIYTHMCIYTDMYLYTYTYGLHNL